MVMYITVMYAMINTTTMVMVMTILEEADDMFAVIQEGTSTKMIDTAEVTKARCAFCCAPFF